MGDTNAVYNLGDMVWAKVPSFPPWPAMVYLAPNDEGYIKESAAGQKACKYHVQFFGPMVERAWSTPGRLIPYKGKAEFDENVEDARNGSNKSKKEFYSLKMNPKLKTAWEDSWKEAEIALQLDHTDRISRFGRFYVPSIKKSKKSVSPNKTATPVEKPVKQRKSESQNDSGDVLTPEEEQVGLDNFIEYEKALLMDETPDIDPDAIEESLRDKWTRMDTKMRRRYVVADYSEFSNETSALKLTESKVSGRKIKPSNKSLDQYTRRSSQGTGNIWKKGIKRHSGSTCEVDDGVSSTPPNKKSKVQTAEDSPPIKSPTKRNSCPVDISDECVNFEIQRLVSSPGDFKVQPVCPICEIHSDYMLQCHGGCFRHFHVECVRTKFQNESDIKINEFECPSCLYNQRECMICYSKNSENKKFVTCSESKCGRIYHQSCISSFPHVSLSDKGQLAKCPAHFCISCVNEKPGCKEAARGNLITCIKCPLAFHAGDICMAAGSIERSLSQVVCPKHFVKSLLVTNKPVTMTSCFVCSKQVITSKIVCSECPGTFHVECLKEKPNNIDDYRCPRCSNMQPIRYSQIVWAKVSHYRWWPCEVIHPRNAPMNILKIAHPDGAFPVHFFGAKEYQWISRQRIIMYEQGVALNLDKQQTKPANKMAKMFTNGMEVVVKAHRLYVAYVSRRLPLTSMSAEPMNEKELMSSIEVKPVKKNTGFKFIKQSIFTKDELKFPEVPISHLPVCSCSPKEAHPCSVASNSSCSNAANLIECHPETCPAGQKCENQVFTKRAFQVMGVFETKNRGHGLRAMDKIPKGKFVVDYVGEIIDRAEMQERLKSARKSGVQDLYMFRLDDQRIIDSGPCGNLSRYINHSCKPNLDVQIWKVNNETRVGFFALQDIDREEELTFNYSNFMIFDNVQLCLCGSNMCQGYLGSDQPAPNKKSLPIPKKLLNSISNDQSPKAINIETKKAPTDIETANQDASVVKKRGRPSYSKISESSESKSAYKKNNVSSYHLHENICYRCLDGGELVLCDKSACTKSYHLGCLGLTKPPAGVWHCPWHHCDCCGLPASHFCSECPNSYCDEHMDDSKIYKENFDKIVCSDHKSEANDSVSECEEKSVKSDTNCSHLAQLETAPVEPAVDEGNSKEAVIEKVDDNNESAKEHDTHEIETDEDDKEKDTIDEELDQEKSEKETVNDQEEDEDIDDGDIIHEDEPDMVNDDSLVNTSVTNNNSAVDSGGCVPDEDDEENESVEEVEIDSQPAPNEDQEMEEIKDTKSANADHEASKPCNHENSFSDMF